MKFSFFFTALLGTFLTTYSQQSINSIYSNYGLGLENFNGGTYQKSMGGSSLVMSQELPNLKNPASYSKLKITSFSIGASTTRQQINTRQNSSKGIATTVDYLSIALPSKYVGIGLGIHPYRSMGYLTTATNEVNNVAQTTQKRGDGNVNRAYLSLSSQLIKGLHIGTEIHYNFGRLEEQTTSYNQTVFSNRELLQSEVSGFSFTTALLYENEYRKNYVSRLTAIYEASNQLEITNRQQLASITTNTATGVDIIENENTNFLSIQDFRLPSKLTLGISIEKKRNWFMSSEMFFTKNNNYQDRIYSRQGVSHRHGMGIRTGGYYIPKYNSLTNYLQKITYRFGFEYHDLGIAINNQIISDFGMSFGMSLPLPRSSSQVDLGLKLGKRGQIASSLIREDYATLSLGLTLGQKWFQKRKYD